MIRQLQEKSIAAMADVWHQHRKTHRMIQLVKQTLQDSNGKLIAQLFAHEIRRRITTDKPQQGAAMKMARDFDPITRSIAIQTAPGCDHDLITLCQG